MRFETQNPILFGILNWAEATGLGYDIQIAQRPGRADGCLIGWLPKLRQGHGFVFKNLQLLKLWDCSHYFTFSMFFFHYFSFRLLASIYWSPGVAWSCIDFSESCPDSLGRSQISAWFRTIAYSSNMFQHLIDIVSILPQGARARWFWILMTACLCRKCRQACVCLRDAFPAWPWTEKNSCQCVCSGSDGRQMAAILKSIKVINAHCPRFARFARKNIAARLWISTWLSLVFRLASTQLHGSVSGTCGGIGVLDATEGWIGPQKNVPAVTPTRKERG